GRDRTKHQVAEVTSLGLVQMTRKRIGTGLAESMVSAGADLSGRGLLLPGSDEDGSKSHRGNRSSGGDHRRDRKRRSDSGSKSKHNETDSHEDSVSSDASRSAAAAIAKAAVKQTNTGSAGARTGPAPPGTGRGRREVAPGQSVLGRRPPPRPEAPQRLGVEVQAQ